MMHNSPDSSKSFAELIQADSSVCNTLPLELQLNSDNDPNQDNHVLDMFRNTMQSEILGNPVTSAEVSPLMSPHLTSPVTSQQQIIDSDTQMSMVRQAAGLHLSDNLPSTINSSQLRIFSTDTDDENLDGSRKVLKVDDSSDASTAFNSVETRDDGDKGFDVGPTSGFEFLKFGFGKQSESIDFSSSPGSSSKSNELICTIAGPALFDELTQHSMASTGSVITIAPSERKEIKEPPLNMGFTSRGGGCELKVLSQPEEQHRARYQTEGSRGAVKDKAGQSYPRVQLLGYNQPVTLQVYIGSDNSKFKPHGFYQACKVSGKNATPCNERDIEGTTVIQILLEPENDMIGLIDCVGILKLRNSDVQQRIGLSRSKKKSTKARMIFRVNIPQPTGLYLTLQVASSQILCTQPTGIPEICRISSSTCSSEGGEDLFVIGKNFLKGTKVHFQEKPDEETVKWEAEAAVDNEYLHASHMIVTIPPYKGTTVGSSVAVYVVVSCGGRTSEGTNFTYTASNGTEGTTGSPGTPGIGMLLPEASLFGPSNTEPDIFNDPGCASPLTFKVEPNVMSPELPPVSEDVRVPMDTGDCPPSKISKISECVSPEAEKLAQDYIVQSSQKNGTANTMYTPEAVNVNKEGVGIATESNLEHMDTEAVPKDTQHIQRKTSMKSCLENVESSVNINAANEELQKLLSETYSDHQSDNPSGTNTPISPGKPGERFTDSLQNSPFTSPEPQLQNANVNSTQINQPQFNSPMQGPPPQIGQEIFAGENPQTPVFSLPQQIQVEQISGCHSVENMNVNPKVQDTNNPRAFMLGNTLVSHSEQQSPLGGAALVTSGNVVDQANVQSPVQTVHAFQEVTRKQDPSSVFNGESQATAQQSSFPNENLLENFISALSADLRNVNQQSPFDGGTSALNTQMPPNVSVEDIHEREAHMTIPMSVHNNPTENKANFNMDGLVVGGSNVNSGSFQAVPTTSVMAQGSIMNYLINSASGSSIEMVSSPAVGFVSSVNGNPAQQTVPISSQPEVTFIPSTPAVNQPEMLLQNTPAVESTKINETVEAATNSGSEPSKDGASAGGDQNLLKDLLKGLNELCGLLKQDKKQEKTEDDVECAKEALMSALPNKSMQLMEVLQSQIKGQSDQTNMEGLLRNMLSQQQQQVSQQNNPSINGGPMIVTSSVNTRPSVQIENYPQVKVIAAQPVIQNGTIQSGVPVITSNAQMVPQTLTTRGLTQVIEQPTGLPLRLVIDPSKSNTSQGVQMANIANITALVQASIDQKANVTAGSTSSPLTFVPFSNGQAFKIINVTGNQPVMIGNQSPGASRPTTFVRGTASSASISNGAGDPNPDSSDGVNIKNGLLAQLLTEPASSLQTVSIPQSLPENMDTTTSTAQNWK